MLLTVLQLFGPTIEENLSQAQAQRKSKIFSFRELLPTVFIAIIMRKGDNFELSVQKIGGALRKA